MPAIFPDVNVSPRFYDKAKDTLLVRTMFATLQGEGPLAGKPAVFLRLGGCNLGGKDVGAPGCAWCDTDFRIAESKYLSNADILEAVRNRIAPYDRMRSANAEQWVIVVTGGEPMLQKNLIGFCEEALIDFPVQIETNGMYHLDLPDETIVVMSPKVGGGRARKYPKPDSHMLDRADHLKFVLEANPNSPYHDLPKYAWDFERPVWVSPMAVYKRPMSAEEGERASAWDASLIDQRATAANYLYAAQYAMTHGLRVSIQQHLFYAMP
jgi:7-carboxy-7-deazaguanine synthase